MPDSTPQDIELTILMPCLDEAETLGRCLDAAAAFLARSGVPGEVVVADNGSTDGSIAIAQAHGARVLSVPVRGYGIALLEGMRGARGKFVIMGDSDGSYDFANLDPFIARLRSGCDLVVGNRFRGGIARHAMPPLHRYLGNPVLSFLGRLFFAVPIGDFHCGLRGVRRDAMLELGLHAPGMEFASEMVVRAALRGLAIDEVPTTLSPDGRSGPSHLRTWRDGWRHLRFLLMLSPRWLFLYPGFALFSIGAIVQGAILTGPVIVGRVVLDIHTMLFAGGAMIVGLQLVLLAVFVKTVGVAHGLLPSSRAFGGFVARFTLERGAMLGAMLTVTGFVLAAWSLSLWMSAGLAEIDPRHVMRIAIPSLTLTIAGIELLFSSFVLHFLLWNRDRDFV